MKTRIRKWEELDKMESDEYLIILFGHSRDFYIRHMENEQTVAMIYDRAPKEKKLEILKIFGFDIGFIETRAYTEEEKAVKTLFKTGWIAREMDGSIGVYKNKPHKSGFNFWQCVGGWSGNLPENLFPEITWHSEPVNLEEIE